jgi:hypothetical protein
MCNYKCDVLAQLAPQVLACWRTANVYRCDVFAQLVPKELACRRTANVWCDVFAQLAPKALAGLQENRQCVQRKQLRSRLSHTVILPVYL